MAKQEDLAAQARRIWERTRDQLIQTLQPGNPRAFAHGTPRSNLTHRSPYSNANQGVSLQSGRMPSPAEITAVAMQNAGYRKLMGKIERGGGSRSSGGKGDSQQTAGTAGAVPASGPSPQMAAYNTWLAQQQQGYDEAKAANEGRYNEGKGELTGVRDFRQEKYANFGVAAQQDIDERMKEALSNARANAASRGLSNSNVTDAYALRAARDTAREQQRVREVRDTRMGDAYAQDTGNLVGFIERRQDPYPDMNQAMQIGIQLAGSEADRQSQAARTAAIEGAYRETGGRGRSDYSLPPVPGPQGGATPMMLNGTPVQQAAAQFASYGPQLGIGSNRYPTQRMGGAIAAPAGLSAQDMAAWLERRRMLPTYKQPVPQQQIPYGPPQGNGPYYA